MAPGHFLSHSIRTCERKEAEKTPNLSTGEWADQLQPVRVHGSWEGQNRAACGTCTDLQNAASGGKSREQTGEHRMMPLMWRLKSSQLIMWVVQICRGKAGRGLSDFRGQWQPLEVAGGEVIMRLAWWEFKMPECGWWGHRRSLFRSVFCSEILSQCPQRQSHCSQANWGWREPDTEDVKWVLLQPTARRQHGALWGGAGSTAGRGRRALGVGRSLLICGYVLM